MSLSCLVLSCLILSCLVRLRCVVLCCHVLKRIKCLHFFPFHLRFVDTLCEGSCGYGTSKSDTLPASSLTRPLLSPPSPSPSDTLFVLHPLLILLDPSPIPQRASFTALSFPQISSPLFSHLTHPEDAHEAKERGNACYKARQYAEAVGYYEQAIKM